MPRFNLLNASRYACLLAVATSVALEAQDDRSSSIMRRQMDSVDEIRDLKAQKAQADVEVEVEQLPGINPPYCNLHFRENDQVGNACSWGVKVNDTCYCQMASDVLFNRSIRGLIRVIDSIEDSCDTCNPTPWARGCHTNGTFTNILYRDSVYTGSAWQGKPLCQKPVYVVGPNLSNSASQSDGTITEDCGGDPDYELITEHAECQKAFDCKLGLDGPKDETNWRDAKWETDSAPYGCWQAGDADGTYSPGTYGFNSREKNLDTSGKPAAWNAGAWTKKNVCKLKAAVMTGATGGADALWNCPSPNTLPVTHWPNDPKGN